ncbi:MAG: class I SAM-dependent methyltransferase [Alphaproteobacteria bacterium]|nr:MAG: class I SAM-dependent methyltransferase [Alphaproteobacteria bacterium]
MPDIENAVARHYGSDGLLQRICDGLRAAGIDPSQVRPDDLAPVDEFHIGGRQATKHAISKMALTADDHVLDIGCGIGGTARTLAARIGCRVTGIDLTPEYIAVAEDLTRMTGLDDRITYHVASALDMPFATARFDAAITIHVAMNIHDREGLYREIARVLRPGAVLCIYDVMKKGEGELTFPVPWADTPRTSHLVTPEEMCALLEAAGFEVEEVEDRTDFGIDFFRKALAVNADGPPPLGTHLVMGPSAAEKFRNVLHNLEHGRIAPVQMLVRRCAEAPVAAT